MLELLREMLHYRNTLGEKELDEGVVKGFEERYDAILDLGDKEYLDTPPSDYYREGYNSYFAYGNVLKIYKNQLLHK